MSQQRGGGKWDGVEEVKKVKRGGITKVTVVEEEFKVDLMLNRKSVEVLGDGGEEIEV